MFVKKLIVVKNICTREKNIGPPPAIKKRNYKKKKNKLILSGQNISDGPLSSSTFLREMVRVNQ